MKIFISAFIILLGLNVQAQEDFWIKPHFMGFNSSCFNMNIDSSSIKLNFDYDSINLITFFSGIQLKFDLNGNLTDSTIFQDSKYNKIAFVRERTGKINPNILTQHKFFYNKAFAEFTDSSRFHSIVTNKYNGDTLFHIDQEQVYGDSPLVFPYEYFSYNDTLFWLGRMLFEDSPFSASFVVGYWDENTGKLVTYERTSTVNERFTDWGIKNDSIVYTICGTMDPDGDIYKDSYSRYVEFNLNTKEYYGKVYPGENTPNDGGGHTTFLGLQKVPSGGYVGCGLKKRIYDTGVNKSVVNFALLVKYDDAFNIEWTQEWPFGTSRLYDIIMVDSSSFIAMGDMVSFYHGENNEPDSLSTKYAWMVKMNADGDTLWNRFYKVDFPGASESYPTFKFAERVADTIYTAGYFRMANRDLAYVRFSPFLGKFDMNGCLGGENCGVELPAKYYQEDVGITDVKPIPLKAYPNPTSSSLTIDLPNINPQEIQLYLTTLSGARYQVPFNITGNSIQLQTHTLAAGLYHITIQTDEQTFIASFMKQ